MKKYLLMIPALLIVLSAGAQTKPVKIVFDVSSKAEDAHQSAVRHVKMMAAAYPESQFELVVYGGALAMVLKDQSSVSEDMLTLEGMKNVSVRVCEQTMKRHEVDKSKLLPGVTTVPDGILEIVTRQGEGWGYIKEANNN